jgi:putative flippase GtrA
MTSLPAKTINSKEIKYVLVGFWNTFIAWIIFVIIQIFFVPPISNTGSVLISYVISMFNSYAMQRAFVWKSSSKVRTELPKFITVSAVQLLLNVLLIRLFVDYLRYPAIATQFIVTIFLIGLTYIALKSWTFKVKNDSNPLTEQLLDK